MHVVARSFDSQQILQEHSVLSEKHSVHTKEWTAVLLLRGKIWNTGYNHRTPPTSCQVAGFIPEQFTITATDSSFLTLQPSSPTLHMSNTSSFRRCRPPRVMRPALLMPLQDRSSTSRLCRAARAAGPAVSPTCSRKAAVFSSAPALSRQLTAEVASHIADNRCQHEFQRAHFLQQHDALTTSTWQPLNRSTLKQPAAG